MSGGLKIRGIGALNGNFERVADGRLDRPGDARENGGEPGSSKGGEESMRRLGPAAGGSSCAATLDEESVLLAEGAAEGGLKAPKAFAGAEVTRLKGVLNELCVGTRCGPSPAAEQGQRKGTGQHQRGRAL